MIYCTKILLMRIIRLVSWKKQFTIMSMQLYKTLQIHKLIITLLFVIISSKITTIPVFTLRRPINISLVIKFTKK